MESVDCSKLDSCSSDVPSDNSYALSFINRRFDDVAVARMAPLNTNINLPPLQAWTYQNNYEKFFKMGAGKLYDTSLDIGRSFMREASSVDFVGSGPTIKRLLMEPYAAGPMSMICHRIGKTIYLDNHSFSKNDLHSLELVSNSYCTNEDQISSSHFQTFPQLSLYENLIWHNKEISDCAAGDESSGLELQLKEFGSFSRNRDLEFPRMFQSYSYKIKPQDSLDGEAYLWEFHDMRMLVDVDLPIFGGGQFPSVSIRLSEETKPISVLTGMDVMLDQLMCNIPETIMVYHQRGVIKEYEVVVKEDIPYLTGSEFDPSKLKTITENMMTFLSKNMTQQGHTYWLFREKSSDEMKLYDLTSLCPHLAKNPQWNPFLVPVIMLLYKLSSELMSQTENGRSSRVSNVVYGLLNAASDLLRDDTLIDHKACIQYHLAGLYLMYGTSSNSEKEDISQNDLLHGLDDIVTDGYARLSATISVDHLKKRVNSSECETLEGKPRSHLPGPTRLPNSGLMGDCCEQALEHCLQALEAINNSDTDSDEVYESFPFIPDGPDDTVALRSLKNADNNGLRLLLRHSILTHAATAYLSLVNQMLCVDRHDKTYNFSRLGIICCAVVLSSCPTERHSAFCYALLQVLVSSLIHSMTQLAGNIVDISILNASSYRDKRIWELATENIQVKESFDFSNMWLSDNTTSISLVKWLELIEIGIQRCTCLMKEQPTCHSKIQYIPTKDALVSIDRVACRLAMVLMQLGVRFTESAQLALAPVDESEPLNERISTALQYTNSAKKYYSQGLSLLCNYSGQTVRECAAIMQANSVTVWKLEYKILVTMSNEAATSERVSRVVDHICISYRNVFSLLGKDIETVNGNSVYVNSLIEFSNALIMFTQDLAEEKDQKWIEKRIYYLEAALRALSSVKSCAGENIRRPRSEAAALSTYVYFQLLSLRYIGIKGKLDGTSRANRSQIRDFMNLIHSANEHLCFLGSTDIDYLAKKAPSEFLFFTLELLRSNTVNESSRLELCIEAIEWNRVVIKNVVETVTQVDETAKVRLEKVWADMQGLLKAMNMEWKNNEKLKKAYLCVLSNLPSDMSLIAEHIQKSLTKVLMIIRGK